MPQSSKQLTPVELNDIAAGVDTRSSSVRTSSGKLLRTQNLIGVKDQLKLVEGMSRRWLIPGHNLNGTDEYFSITNASQTALHQTGSFTVEVIVETPAAFGGDDTVIARWTGTTATNQYRLRINSTGVPVFEVSDGTTEESKAHGTTLSVSTVYVLKASWSTGNGLRLAVYDSDLALVGTTVTLATAYATLNSSTTPDTTLGGRSGGGDYLTGVMSYARYQNAEDTAVPSFTLSAATKGLWRHTLNTTLTDHSGNANHLTANNVTSADDDTIDVKVPPMLGVPIHTDTYEVTDGTQVILATTDDRHYQFNASTKVWQDYTGVANLTGSPTTGTSGQQFYDSTLGMIYVLTNKNDRVLHRASQTANLAVLSNSLGAGYFARVFRDYKNRGNLYNITSAGTVYPTRHQWSSANQVGDGDWDITNDFTDVGKSSAPIIQVMNMNDELFIYKENSEIIKQFITGQAAPFWGYQTVYSGIAGLASMSTLVDTGLNLHLYLALGDIIKFDGQRPVSIGEEVYTDIIDQIVPGAVHACFSIWDAKEQTYKLFFPTADNTYSKVYWAYNLRKNAWYGPVEVDGMGSFSYGGVFIDNIASTWANAEGTWVTQQGTWLADVGGSEFPVSFMYTSAGEPYRSVYTITTFDGTAIPAQITTKDLFFSDPDTKLHKFSRWQEVELEASFLGSPTITMEYSTDAGVTYTSLGSPSTTTYDTLIRRYTWYPDVVSDKLRLRFTKTGGGQMTLVRMTAMSIPMEQR